MDEDARKSLKNLGDRLDKARATAPRPPGHPSPKAADREALGFGMRIGLELVGAVVVMGAIGWAIDRWFGTKPFGIVVGFFLGIGAGMWNVFRAVNRVNKAVGARNSQTAAGWNDDED